MSFLLIETGKSFSGSGRFGNVLYFGYITAETEGGQYDTEQSL